jgi:hypothetical protein
MSRCDSHVNRAVASESPGVASSIGHGTRRVIPTHEDPNWAQVTLIYVEITPPNLDGFPIDAIAHKSKFLRCCHVSRRYGPVILYT